MLSEGMSMKQVIYVDVLVALNMMISFFLLAAARRLGGEQVRVWRMVLGSLLGGASSLTIFLPQSSLPLSFLLRAVLLLPVVFAVFGFGSLRRFTRLWLVTAGVSCLFAGALVGAWFLLKPNGLVLRNGAVYFEIGFLPLVLGCGVFYAAVWLFHRFFSKRKQEQAVCEVRFDHGGRSFLCRGLVDTGNTLKDPFTGQAVQVISESLARRVVPEYFPPVNGELPRGFRLIPCATAKGEGLLPAFDVTGFSAKDPHETARLERTVLAVSSAERFEQGCEVLVNAAIPFEFGKGDENHEHQTNHPTAFQKNRKKKQRTDPLHQRTGHPAGAAERQTGEGADGAHRRRRRAGAGTADRS